MSNKKCLTDIQHFLLYFILSSMSITVISFMSLVRWFPGFIIIFNLLFYPLLLSPVSGIFRTKYYLTDLTKKVFIFTSIFLIVVTLLSIYYYQNNVKKDVNSVEEFIFVGLIFSLIPIMLFFIGDQISSRIVSKFLLPKYPEENKIKENILTYDIKDHAPKEIINAFEWFSLQTFNYQRTKKEFENKDHIATYLKANIDGFMFIDYLKESKRLLIFPFLLIDYIKVKTNIEETERIRNFLSIFQKFTPVQLNNNEFKFFLSNFKEATKPISRDTLNLVKSILVPGTIGGVVTAISLIIILYYEQITDFLLSNASGTMNTAIGAVIGSIITLVVIGVAKKTYDSLKKKFSS